jgi:DNA polymerase III delta subunit
MILLLYGEDAFRSREKLNELKGAYLKKNPDGSGFFEFRFDAGAEGADARVADLIASLETGGLFATKKLVAIRGALGASEMVRKPLLDFLDRDVDRIEKDADTVAVFWEEGVPKKTNKLFRLLDGKAERKQHFESLQGVKLEQWAVKRLQSSGATIGRPALQRLLLETGSDLFRLEGELAKLANFVEGRTIAEADVDALLAGSVKATVFEALEALSSGQKARALKLFADQVAKGENALYLLSMCAWQLRNLLRVADAYSQGLRAAPLLAKQLKLHPFVVQKLLRQVPSFPLDRLKKSFALLTDLDVRSKSGALDPKLALDLFVVKF